MKHGWAKIPQIAPYMGLSERTVRKLLKEGLRCCRLPSGTVLVKYSDADAFLEQFIDDEGERVDAIVDEVMEGLTDGK